MGDPAGFAADCRTASRQLRRLPADLRKALAADVQSDVAAPLAQKVASASSGPWGTALGNATKARKLSDPTIVIGGAKRVVSGGASARQLVYGREFGSNGSRVANVPAGNGHRAYRRRSTRQFVRNHRPFVFPTIDRSAGFVLDKFASIVDKVLGGVQ